MRRKSEEQPEETEPDLEPEEDEVDGVFDVDEYEESDADEVEETDDAGYFEDGDLYVADEEVEEAEEAEEAQAVEGPEEVDAAEEDEDEPAEETDGKPTGPEQLRDPVTLKVKALWAELRTQVRAIELPGAPEAGRKRVLTVAAIVLASLLLGTGTYLLANGTGTDVEQAKLEGQVAGREAGAIEGAAQGYSTGFRKGRLKGFRKAYVPAYRIYYKRAFEQAGLDPPSNEQFDVPVP